jgi:hypothetical protein
VRNEAFRRERISNSAEVTTVRAAIAVSVVIASEQ